jgi:hypothetical protein
MLWIFAAHDSDVPILYIQSEINICMYIRILKP